MSTPYKFTGTRGYVNKIKSSSELAAILSREKESGKKVAFTNGCFDILHTGHIRYLHDAAELADILVVAVNSDASVRIIKGAKRPIVPEEERLEVLAALEFIDYVVTFDEPDPYEIISALMPDILVKGADWGPDDIIGRDVVESGGGRVERVALTEGASTSNIIEKIIKTCK